MTCVVENASCVFPKTQKCLENWLRGRVRAAASSSFEVHSFSTGKLWSITTLFPVGSQLLFRHYKKIRPSAGCYCVTVLLLAWEIIDPWYETTQDEKASRHSKDWLEPWSMAKSENITENRFSSSSNLTSLQSFHHIWSFNLVLGFIQTVLMFQSRPPKKSTLECKVVWKRNCLKAISQSLGRRQPIAQSCLDTWHLLLAVSGSFLLLPFQQCQLYILPPS